MAPHESYLSFGALVRQIAIQHFGIDALSGQPIRHAFRRSNCDLAHDPRMYVPQVPLALHWRYRSGELQLMTTGRELSAVQLEAAG